jgi:hypothetical protein
MAHSKNISRIVLTLVSAITLGASGLGCASTVTTSSSSNTDGEGGSGDAEGGSGDAEGGSGDAEGGSDDGEGGSGGGDNVVAQDNGDTCDSYAGDGCTPGETKPCFDGPSPFNLTMTCSLVANQYCTTEWSRGDCNTPLVLSFDGAPIEYLADRHHAFDINGSQSLVTDWPTAKTPWLAIDRDGNGRIDDGSELFGSMSILASGGRAQNGFVALRELDEDGDSRITPNDPAFSRLLVWSDGDGDRRSASGELVAASASELVSIELDYTSEPRCNARGDCEVERASFRYRDASFALRTGVVVDIHLAPQR